MEHWQAAASPILITPSLLKLFCIGTGILIVHVVLRYIRHRSISYLPGPQGAHWLFGHFPDIFRNEPATATECRWIDEYGPVMRIKGVFKADTLLLSDPKAIQFILNTSGYNFKRPGWHKATSSLILGGAEGLNLVHGVRHSRQRRIMTPAFHFSTLREFIPIFRNNAQKLVLKWKDILAESGGPTEIEVAKWLTRTTLDALGEAAFDHKFGALDEDQNELAKAYQNIISDISYKRPDFLLFWEAICGYLPFWAVRILQKVSPGEPFKRARGYSKVSRAAARNVVKTRTEAYLSGKEAGKDLMSLLIKANMSENPKTKLTDDEIMSQMTTFMLAGHETTSKTISWALFALSKHPDCQSRAREEIKRARENIDARGDSELTMSDLDSMKYLVAVIKEALRLHPILPFMVKESVVDLSIPLSSPATTKSGEMITAIPISAGQEVLISIAGYNKSKAVWGEDADVWRPGRFLEDTSSLQTTNVGVVSNIVTFSSGLRSCIGWRFAMVEMQTFLITLLDNFEFTPTSATHEVIPGPSQLVVPMLKSQPGRIQLPLLVTAVEDTQVL